MEELYRRHQGLNEVPETLGIFRLEQPFQSSKDVVLKALIFICIHIARI